MKPVTLLRAALKAEATRRVPEVSKAALRAGKGFLRHYREIREEKRCAKPS